MRTISLIIIHCSATKAGQRYGFGQCREDHLKRGWKDIGYHYYITRDGVVHRGRPEGQVGAHCPGFDVLMDYWDLEPEGLLTGEYAHL